MIYCISDIHGEYEKYIALLEKIKFSENDKLYVLGDVIDRGKNPIKVLQHMMKSPNIIPIAGNHEIMAINCLKFLKQNNTKVSFSKMMDSNMLNEFVLWAGNGGNTTLEEFQKLNDDEKQDIIEYIGEFSLYEEVETNGKKYILVHAGLGNFLPEKALEEYSIDELVWERPDYSKTYFPDKYIISGHTPTQYIPENEKPGYIYKSNNNIAIDCGAFFSSRLSAICLETLKEFYSNDSDKSN